MVFSAVSMDEDTDDLVGVDKKTHTRLCALLRHIDTDLVRKQSTAALSEQKWKCSSYLAVSTDSGISLFEEGRESLLACDTYSVWWGVFLSSFFLLADWHRKWSCLSGASTCFWVQSICSKPQSTVSGSIWYQRLIFFTRPREAFTSKIHLG